MKRIEHVAEIGGNHVTLELATFDSDDAQEIGKIFLKYCDLNTDLVKYGRRVNIPEALSETIFCLFSGSARFLKKTKGKGTVSYDTLNLTSGVREQIKASTMEFDVTSFGPKTEWDKLFFMSFYNGGKIDGTFDVYEIPTDFIYLNKVNKGQTMADQKTQSRRPRFSIMRDIIIPNKIQPLGKAIKVW